MSETSKRAPKNPPRVDVLERSTQTDWDLLLQEIIERREREPFAMRSLPIVFTDPSLDGHWINRDKYPDAIAKAKQNGWRGATPAMVVDLDQLGAYGTSPDGYLVRGERGNELLMVMPKAYVHRVAMAKTAENNRRMGNPNLQRNDAIEAFGKGNPDAAELVAKGDVKQRVAVKDTYERIAVSPDPE